MKLSETGSKGNRKKKKKDAFNDIHVLLFEEENLKRLFIHLKYNFFLFNFIIVPLFEFIAFTACKPPACKLELKTATVIQSESTKPHLSRDYHLELYN